MIKSIKKETCFLVGRSERISLPTHGKKERIDKECDQFFLSDFILFASKFSLPFVCVCVCSYFNSMSPRVFISPQPVGPELSDWGMFPGVPPSFNIFMTESFLLINSARVSPTTAVFLCHRILARWWKLSNTDGGWNYRQFFPMGVLWRRLESFVKHKTSELHIWDLPAETS